MYEAFIGDNVNAKRALSHAVIAGYAIGCFRFHWVITDSPESSTPDNDTVITGGTEERICASWVILSYNR